MEVMILEDGKEQWTQQESVLGALLEVQERPVRAVLIFSRSSDLEEHELAVAIRLMRLLTCNGAELVAATPHPTAGWLRAVMEAGASRALVLERDGFVSGVPVDLSQARVIEDDICPMLHARTVQGITASVCGEYCDKRVLARRCLKQWCLARWKECPELGRQADCRGQD